MKHITALLLIFALLLSGCSFVERANQRPSQSSDTPQMAASAPEAAENTPDGAVDPTQVPTTEPTTVPTEPEVFFNPLNGEILDAPFTGRIFANTVSNMQENLPHVGVTQADMLIETYVNMKNIIRCIALYTDIESVNAIGSTRSTRPIFNQIAQHYDLILSHAGGSNQALEDAQSRGIDNFNIDAWVVASTGASYRDEEYKRSYENTLFGVGPGIKAYAESQGMNMELERDYGLTFTEDGTPAGGEDALKVSINFVYGQAKKETVMAYDSEAHKYVFNQYGQRMTDQITGETEMFTNVLVMQAGITNSGIYHVADFNAGGTGYFACGGKIVPIIWTCDGDKEPFRFFTTDNAPLNLGMGNTYLAICSTESSVIYSAADSVQETVPSTT